VATHFRAIGSGVIIDRQGRILTNFHVAGRARRIEVILADRQKIAARRIGADHWTDLALIQLDRREMKAKHVHFKWAELGNSSHVMLGQPVMAIGTPYGLARTVTRGIISNTDRFFNASTIDGYETGQFNNWLQTDAAINPGNSGGPLINLKGQVIGINTRGDPDANNLGFAIPINVARSVIPSLERYGRVYRSYIGINFQPLRDLHKFYHIGPGQGVLVRSVDPSSPARKAGVQPQDVVLAVNGHHTNCQFPEQLARIRNLIASQPIGSMLTLSIDRLNGNNQVQHLVIRVKTQRLESAIAPQHLISAWGIVVRNLTTTYLRESHLPMLKGVLVTSIRSDSPADRAGIEDGDIIVRVGSQVIANSKEMKAAALKVDKKDIPVAVVIRRGRTRRTLVFTPRKHG
jgi:serine protease Do